MAKIRKFQILKVPVEVEYKRPVLGRLYWFFYRLRLIRFFKINTEFCGETVCSAVWLCVPVISRGESDERLL